MTSAYVLVIECDLPEDDIQHAAGEVLKELAMTLLDATSKARVELRSGVDNHVLHLVEFDRTAAVLPISTPVTGDGDAKG